MNHHWLRKRIVAVLIAVVTLGALSGARTVDETDAAWVDEEHGSATFTAGVLGQPTGITCLFSGRTFTPIWAAPSLGVPPERYEYRVYRTITGPTTPWQSTTSTQWDYQVSGLLELLSVFRFEVRAVAGSWVSPVRTGQAVVTLSLLGVISIDSCSWGE